jgi:dihydroorotate dehydrogenase
MLARVYRLTEGKLPLIGVGGIDSGEAALAKIAAGASLIQLYTGLVFEGLGLIGRIKQALVAAIERAKGGSLAPLIGARAGEWASR